MNETTHNAEIAATPARDDHAYWASVCICGLSEQERTGHYPEHAEWCEVPSPMDDDEEEPAEQATPAPYRLDNPKAVGAPANSRWGYLPCGCSHDGRGGHIR